MATYKVIQDIEAEDKLIGPFGIRQFIYLIVVFVCLFISFRIVTAGVWFIALPFLPIILFFGLLALPFGGEQPTETWLLAKIRFAVKPRIRIWNQSGMQELVTITAPKKLEKVLTKNMSEGEVRSRLEALANTIDSRGWAIKNINVNVFSQPALAGTGSDRLVNLSSMQQTPATDITATDDMLDEQNNPTAQNLERMISASSRAYREQVVANMKLPDPAITPPPPVNDSAMRPTPGATGVTGTAKADNSAQDASAAKQPDYWFLNSNTSPTALPQATAPATGTALQGSGNLVTPDPSAVLQQQSQNGLPLQPLAPPTGPLSEEELLNKLHAEKQHAPKNYGNMRVIKTLEEQQTEAAEAAKAAAKPPDPPPTTATQPPEPPVTPAPDPDIIELANNDDLNVATIARQANKKPKKQDKSDGEVVIKLH